MQDVEPGFGAKRYQYRFFINANGLGKVTNGISGKPTLIYTNQSNLRRTYRKVDIREEDKKLARRRR